MIVSAGGGGGRRNACTLDPAPPSLFDPCALYDLVLMHAFLNMLVTGLFHIQQVCSVLRWVCCFSAEGQTTQAGKSYSMTQRDR